MKEKDIGAKEHPIGFIYSLDPTGELKTQTARFLHPNS
jgi:hypothetical protein